MKLTLQVFSKIRLAVIRLPPKHAIPDWILRPLESSPTTSSIFLSITRTHDELSVVCPESLVTQGNNDNFTEQEIEKGWVAFKVCGPLDFGLTGILAGLATPLAAEGISIFAISTYDTDYILVKEDKAGEASKVFEKLGHTVAVDLSE